MKNTGKFLALVIVAGFALAGCMKAPMACAEAPATGTVGQSLSFSSACSMNAEMYEWNFGDGSAVSTSASATHSYTTAGTYTVTLMVMDMKEKNMDETSKTVTIN
jgi:PKD repeat protein